MKPVMVIDVKRCIGCRACVAACALENGQMFPAAHPTQEGLPMTVKLRTWVSWQETPGPEPSRKFVSSLCQQCETNPCVRACPTGASYRTADGVGLVDKDLCIGCGYCLVACPYGMRYRPEPAEDARIRQEPLMLKIQEGTGYGGVIFEPPVPNRWAYQPDAVDKCTFCYHRKAGDGLWQPACVEVCPTNSRMFGDLDDPKDPVAERVRSGKARALRPDLGTGAQVYYEG